jgi:hypothetical protein
VPKLAFQSDRTYESAAASCDTVAAWDGAMNAPRNKAINARVRVAGPLRRGFSDGESSFCRNNLPPS